MTWPVPENSTGAAGLQPWAEVTPLRFTETAVEADAQIRVSWPSGNHGDGSPFDGFGNVLAHALTLPHQ